MIWVSMQSCCDGHADPHSGHGQWQMEAPKGVAEMRQLDQQIISELPVDLTRTRHEPEK